MNQLRTAVMCGVAAIVGCTVRICQLLYMTDPATGFFYPRYEALGTVLTIFYLALFVATVVISFCEMKGTAKITVRGIDSRIFIGLAAVFTLAELPGALTSGANPVALALNVILTVGTAVFLCVEALYGLGRVTVSANIRRWLCVFPLIFWFMQTATAFTKYMGVANISENLFDLAAMGAITLFFLLYGKSVNGVDTTQSVRLAVPVGLSAALLCLICSIPRFATEIFAPNLLHSTTAPEFLYIVMALAVVYLLPRRISAKR